MLALIGCAHPSPPCNREDVQRAYDATGQVRTDAVSLTNACLDRILGDLDACYTYTKR
jgi:hypothetical protein